MWAISNKFLTLPREPLIAVTSGRLIKKNHLDLQAGIIAGHDVTLTATRGDVINERTVTTRESGSGYRNERADFVDNAARIESADSLIIKACLDFNNTGGVQISGADTTITAGRVQPSRSSAASAAGIVTKPGAPGGRCLILF
jgi:adhesin HecA-like repeat protein